MHPGAQPTALRFEDALLRALEANAWALLAGLVILVLDDDRPARRSRRNAPKRP